MKLLFCLGCLLCLWLAVAAPVPNPTSFPKDKQVNIFNSHNGAIKLPLDALIYVFNAEEIEELLQKQANVIGAEMSADLDDEEKKKKEKKEGEEVQVESDEYKDEEEEN